MGAKRSLPVLIRREVVNVRSGGVAVFGFRFELTVPTPIVALGGEFVRGDSSVNPGRANRSLLRELAEHPRRG